MRMYLTATAEKHSFWYIALLNEQDSMWFKGFDLECNGQANKIALFSPIYKNKSAHDQGMKSQIAQ